MVSMAQIAKKAGVSRTTVSYVLNDRQREDGSISEETRQRVLKAAAALGYELNELARSMIAGRSKMLAILSDSYDGEMKFRIISGVLEAAQSAGYLVKMVATPFRRVTSEALATCARWRVSGILVVNPAQEAFPVLKAGGADRGIPVAFADYATKLDWAMTYFSDDEQGMDTAFRYLVELGHRRIGFFNGVGSSVAIWRDQIFRERMASGKPKLANGGVVSSDWNDVTQVERAARKLLGLRVRPTAVICSSDVFAMGLLRVARSLNLSVPRDLSVIGFSNYTLSELADPALTTIEQPFHRMGKLAAEALIEAAEGVPAVIPRQRKLENQLVIRESCGPVRKQ